MGRAERRRDAARSWPAHRRAHRHRGRAAGEVRYLDRRLGPALALQHQPLDVLDQRRAADGARELGDAGAVAGLLRGAHLVVDDAEEVGRHGIGPLDNLEGHESLIGLQARGQGEHNVGDAQQVETVQPVAAPQVQDLARAQHDEPDDQAGDADAAEDAPLLAVLRHDALVAEEIVDLLVDPGEGGPGVDGRRMVAALEPVEQPAGAQGAPDPGDVRGLDRMIVIGDAGGIARRRPGELHPGALGEAP